MNLDTNIAGDITIKSRLMKWIQCIVNRKGLHLAYKLGAAFEN